VKESEQNCRRSLWRQSLTSFRCRAQHWLSIKRQILLNSQYLIRFTVSRHTRVLDIRDIYVPYNEFEARGKSIVENFTSVTKTVKALTTLKIKGLFSDMCHWDKSNLNLTIIGYQYWDVTSNKKRYNIIADRKNYAKKRMIKAIHNFTQPPNLEIF